MERLMTYLKQTSEGEIANTAELEKLLAECWNEFGGDCGGMEPYKLLGRMEYVFWEHPILKFVIERHGSTVMGSSRAKLQHWTVDVEHKIATYKEKGYRQVGPKAPRWYVKPVADELAKLIIGGSKHEWLQWSNDGRVRILTKKIIPPGCNDTLDGRRKRLNKALEGILAPHGWQRNGSWWERK